MSKFEITKTEYGIGVYGGADYGGQIRVLMRSPKAVMFVARGVHIQLRRSNHYADTLHVSHDTRPKEFTDAGTAMIERIFGEGAAPVAFEALTRKGTGTVLVDGGGDVVPLPSLTQRRNVEAEYAAATATNTVVLTGLKQCRQCGNDLSPHTTTHHLGRTLKDNHPTSVEDCQRLTNEPVIAVHGFSINERDRWQYVEQFETWDGESYYDDLFCNDRCAVQYGRRAADELPPLEPNNELRARPHNEHRSVDHYEKVERTIVIDGKTFKF